MAQMDALALEAAEEVFGHGVVIGIALAGHALPDAEAGETLTVSVGGVLDAAVGVEDEAGQRLAAPDGHAEGGESEICVDAVGEGVADDLLCAKARRFRWVYGTESERCRTFQCAQGDKG